MFIINLEIIVVLCYYFYIVTIEEKEEQKEKKNPIIILKNNNDTIIFYTILEFYYTIENKFSMCMIEYLRRHNYKPYTIEEVKELIKLYYKEYEIIKLDL